MLNIVSREKGRYKLNPKICQLYTLINQVFFNLFSKPNTYFTMKKITLLFTYLLMTCCLMAQNQAPNAVDDTPTVIEGSKLLGEVILNDDDPDNDSIFTTLLTVPEGGIEVSNGVLEYFCANGSFCYQPDPNFVGVDTFTYVLTDSLGSMDTATVFIEVIAPDDSNITYGASLLRACVVTDHPCRVTVFERPDPCEIPLKSLNQELVSENTSDIQNSLSEKSALLTTDTCDFLMIYDEPDFGNLYLTSASNSNVDTTAGDININGLFYYEPTLIGATADTFGLLKCGILDNGIIYCDSIEVVVEIIYDEPCDYTAIDTYCCVSTTTTFPCDVLTNDSEAIASIFPDSIYTVSAICISDILMSSDTITVNINTSKDSLLYESGDSTGMDSLVYQVQFTVTNNITGETLNFVSTPQDVFILVDDSCTLVTQTTVDVNIMSGTLCIPPSGFLEVMSESFTFGPDGTLCSNDLLSDYIIPIDSLPNGVTFNDSLCFEITTDTPDFIPVKVCEKDDPNVCQDVVIWLDRIAPAEIPTLSEWGLIILALLMLIIGTVAIKNEQQIALELSS